MKNLLRNVGALYALQVSNYLLPLISLPLLTRRLELEGFGRFSVAMAIGQYLAMFADWSFNIEATREIASDAGGRNLRRIFWTTQFARFSLGAVVSLVWVLVCLVAWKDPAERAVYLASIAAVVAGLLTPTWLFQGLQRLEVSSVTSILSRILGVGLLALFVHSPSDDAVAVLVSAGATAIGGFVAMAVVMRRDQLRFEPVAMADVWAAVVRGASVFFSLTVSTMYVTATVPIVRALTSEAAAGAYAAAERLVRTVTSLPMPISQAIFPEISRRFSQEKQTAFGLVRWTLLAMGCIGGAAMLALLVGAPWAVQFLFGTRYEEATVLIRLLSAMPLLIAISNVIGLQVLLAAGRRRAFAVCLTLGAISYLTLILPLTSALGTRGSALAVVIAEGFVTVSMLVLLLRDPAFRKVARGGSPRRAQ